MRDFEILYNEIHEENLRNKQLEFEQKKINGEIIYLDYCIWCNAFNNGKGKDNIELFAKFLKETNTELELNQRKHIAEKFFNLTCEWDYNKNNFVIQKNN